MRQITLALLCIILLVITGCSKKETSLTVPAEQWDQANHPGNQQVNETASNQHLQQAKVAYSKDKYKQAIQHCEKAIMFNRQNWEAYYYIGLSMQKRREYADAIDMLQNGLNHSPQNNFVKSELHYAIGYSWEKLGKLDNAKTAYTTALAFNPENHSAQQAKNRIKIEKTLKNWGKQKNIDYEG
ncbi:MAG: tetratricopeptide repeat protein [candidate division Zixibacteria bacterium]|nr:tetratricopeptide repeat protein [candidate division Zixibacteria bacterium]